MTLIRAENKRTQQIGLAEEKSQSLRSQKSPQWAEHMYFKKEKNRYFEWHNKLWYAGAKSARNILINLSPNRPDRNPGPTYNSVPSLLYLALIRTLHLFSWQKHHEKVRLKNTWSADFILLSHLTKNWLIVYFDESWIPLFHHCPVLGFKNRYAFYTLISLDAERLFRIAFMWFHVLQCSFGDRSF